MEGVSAVIAWGRSQQKDFLLRDFFTFAKYSGMCPDIDEESYKPICDFLESRLPNTPTIAEWRLRTGRISEIPEIWFKRYGMFRTPRLTYKTSLISALCLYAYLLDHSIRIMLGRATTKMAEETLRGITTHIEQNELLTASFGKLRSHFVTWTTEEIVSSKRDAGIREPTIGTTGLNTSKTGAHLDLVILDDLVHELNFESPDQMETARRLVSSFTPVMMGWGSILVVGTNWGDNDLYAWIEDEDDKKVQDELAKGKHAERVWDRFVLGAYKDEATGELNFPKVLPEAKIEEYRRDPLVDSKMFAAWILNKRRAEGEDIFTLNYIQYFEGEFAAGVLPELRLDPSCTELIKRFGRRIPLQVVMLVDPAPTVGKHSDFTGLVVVGFDLDANWWVLLGEELKMLPTPRLAYMTEVAQQFPPTLVALENADLSAPMFEDKLKRKGLHAEVVSFDPRLDRRKITSSALAPKGRTKKAAQIERLEHPLKEGRVFFSRGTTLALVRQLTKYPYLDHDDVIDAFSMAQAYERKMVLSARELTAAKVDERLEKREFELEGLDFDGSDLDAGNEPEERTGQWAGPGSTRRPAYDKVAP